MTGTFNEPECYWLMYMVQVEAPSTPECQPSPCTMHQTMHWTMNRTMNRTINGTINRTLNHEPWTINQGLTLSTIRSSFYKSLRLCWDSVLSGCNFQYRFNQKKTKRLFGFCCCYGKIFSFLTGLFHFLRILFFLCSVLPDTCVDWDREPRLLEALQV